MFAQLLEESFNVARVGSGVSVKDDIVIEIRRNFGEVFDDFVNNFDEPLRRRAASLWRDQLQERRVSAQNAVRGICVFMDRDLMER